LANKIAAPIRRLHGVADRMRQRLLDHVVGVRGGLGRPVAEGRAEAVRSQLATAELPRRMAYKREFGHRLAQLRARVAQRNVGIFVGTIWTITKKNALVQ
jgi:hypothetical protein